MGRQETRELKVGRRDDCEELVIISIIIMRDGKDGEESLSMRMSMSCNYGP